MPKQFTDADTALILTNHRWVGFKQRGFSVGEHDLIEVATIYHRPFFSSTLYRPSCGATLNDGLSGYNLVRLEVAKKVARACKRCYA